MDEIFASLSDTFSKQENIRDLLRERRDVAEGRVRTAQRMSSAFHTAPDITDAVKGTRAALQTSGEALQKLEECLPDEAGAFYRYHDIWRNTLQNVAHVAVLVEFVENDTLADVDGVVQLLGAKVQLPLEDYLIAVCNAVSELARLCMNRVTVGDFDTPRRCAAFANNVFEAFKQLNFRNDFLRKRYDGMKYDVKRIEEIMYDLSIRGLLKKGKATSASESLPDAIQPPDTTQNSEKQEMS